MDNLTTWSGLGKIELFRAMDNRSHWRVMVANAVNRARAANDDDVCAII